MWAGSGLVELCRGTRLVALAQADVSSILLGDFSECGPSDLTCLCKSPIFHASVDLCFKAQCSAEQAAIGASYSEQACWELVRLICPCAGLCRGA